jgi:TolB-like protein
VKVYKVPIGIKAATPIVKEEKPRSKTWRKAALAVAAIIVLGAVAIWNFSFRQAPMTTDVEGAPKTIAVLPFDNLSPDPEQEYFVLGLSEEILNSISKISGLHVTSKTSSFAFKESDKTIKEIAEILGREYILEGSVRKAGDSLRITAQLIHVADDRHLWSETYDRELKDIFKIQEDIANNVADKLEMTLDAFQLLGGTENIEAYEFYLVAKGQYYDYELSQALESIDAAVKLDPGFALAWIWKSKVLVEVAANKSSARFSVEIDKALEAARKAKELEPGLGQVYLWLGSIHRIKRNFIDMELAHRKGMELTTDPIDYFEYGISSSYCVLGYSRKHYEFLEEIRENDPHQPQLHAEYMLVLGYLGYDERAEEEYERGKVLFGNKWDYGHGYITVFRLGAHDDLSISEIPELPVFDPIWSIAREHIESKQEGLSELHRIYGSNENLSAIDLQNISIFAAHFGDPEFSLNAMEKSVSLRTGALHFIWAPVFREVRQLPRFKEFMGEIGLVDYYKTYGWPDLCHPVGDDDFECD